MAYCKVWESHEMKDFATSLQSCRYSRHVLSCIFMPKQIGLRSSTWIFNMLFSERSWKRHEEFDFLWGTGTLDILFVHVYNTDVWLISKLSLPKATSEFVHSSWCLHMCLRLFEGTSDLNKQVLYCIGYCTLGLDCSCVILLFSQYYSLSWRKLYINGKLGKY